jgi:hypothetical protein
VLVRRDHTDISDASGKLTNSFEQLMAIYPEAGTLHGDYFDGQHIIHYTSATVVPGTSVTFASAPAAGPVFHLTYTLQPPATLAVTFAMAAPGSTDFHTIASGTLLKAH